MRFLFVLAASLSLVLAWPARIHAQTELDPELNEQLGEARQQLRSLLAGAHNDRQELELRLDIANLEIQAGEQTSAIQNFTSAFRIADDGGDLTYNFNSGSFEGAGLEHASEVIDFAEALHFLDDAPNLRIFEISGYRHSNLFAALAKTVAKSKQRQAVRAALAKRPSHTLGVELFDALLEDNPKSAVARLVITHADEWKRIPPSRRDEMGRFLKALITGPSSRTALTPEVTAALRPLLELDEATALQHIDVILAAERLEQTGYPYSKHPEALVKLLKQIATTHRDQAVSAAQHYLELKDQQSAAEPQNGRLSTVREYGSDRLLVDLTMIPEITSDMLRLADTSGRLDQPRWLSKLLSGLESQPKEDAPRIWMAFLDQTPWVAEAAAFRNPWISLSRHRSVLSQAVNDLRYIEAKAKAKVLAHLKEKTRPTFGEAYVLALLSGGTKALTDFCAQHSADFAKLSKPSAAQFLQSLRISIPNLDLSPELAKVLQPLYAAEDEYYKQRRLQWMKRTALDDGSETPTDQLDEAHETLDQTARLDRKQAIEFFDHIGKLLQAQVRNQPIHGSRWEQWIKESLSVPEILDHVLELNHEINPEVKDYVSIYQAVSEQLTHSRGSRILPLLNCIGVLSSGSQFHLYLRPTEAGGDNILSFLKAVCHAHTDIRAHLLEQLAAIQPRTLGLEITTAALQPDSATSLLTSARQHSAEIAALPQECRADFAKYLIGLMKHPEQDAQSFPDLTEELMARLQEVRQEHASDLDEFLKLPDFAAVVKKYCDQTGYHPTPSMYMSELGQAAMSKSSSQVEISVSRVLHLIGIVRPYDAKRADEALHKLVSLVEKEALKSNHRTISTSPFRGLVSLMLAEPALVPTATELARERDLQADRFWSTISVHRILPGLREHDAAAIMASLQDIGLLDAAEHYDPIQWDKEAINESTNMVPRSNQRSLLHHLVQEILTLSNRSNSSTADPSLPNRLAEQLLAHQPPTFGCSLVAALLTGPKSPAWDALGRRSPKEFASLPTRSKGMIFDALKLWDSRMRQPTLPANFEAFASLRDASKQEAQEYVKALETKPRDFPQPSAPAVGISAVLDTELTRLVTTDPNQAVNLFQNACASVEDGQSPAELNLRQTAFQPSPTRIRYLQERLSRNNNLAGLVFAIKCLNSDRSGYMHPAGTGTNLDLLTVLQSIWFENGGRAAPLLAAEKILEQLKDKLGDEPPAYLAIPFHDWIASMLDIDREEIIRWASAQPPSAKSYPLAVELAIAGKLYDAAALTMTAPPSSQAPLPDLSDCWKHYLQILEDSSINPGVRAAIANHLCHVYGYLVPDALLLEGARGFVQSYSAGLDLSSDLFYPLLQRFAEAPKSAAWTEICDTYWTKWSAWQGSHATLATHWNMPTLLCPPTTMASRSEGNSRLSEVVGKLPWLSIDVAPTALIPWGRTDQALDLIKNRWNLSSFGAAIPFQRTVSPHLADLFTAVESSKTFAEQPELGWLAELLLLKGSEVPAAQRRFIPGYRTRPEYFRDLATRVAKSKMTNEALYPQVLTVLTMSDATCAGVIDEALTKAAQKVTAEDLEKGHNSAKSWPAMLLACHAVRCALKGDFDTAANTFTKIDTHLPSDTHRLNPPKEQYVELVMTSLSSEWVRMPREQKIKALALFSAWLDELAPRAETLSIELLTTIKMYGFWADALDNALYNDLSAKVRIGIWFGIWRNIPKHLSAQMSVDPTATPPEIRKRLLIAVVQNQMWTDENSFDHAIRNLIRESGVWTRQEVLGFADALVEAEPRGGETAADLAEWAFDLGQKDLSLKLLETAVKQATTAATTPPQFEATDPRGQLLHNTPHRFISPTTAKLLKAAYLIRLHRNTEATEMLEAVSGERLPDQARAERDALTQLLRHP